MSQENVEIAPTDLREWEHGNRRAGAELLAPEIESTWPSEFPTGGTYRGPERTPSRDAGVAERMGASRT